MQRLQWRVTGDQATLQAQPSTSEAADGASVCVETGERVEGGMGYARRHATLCVCSVIRRIWDWVEERERERDGELIEHSACTRARCSNVLIVLRAFAFPPASVRSS